jgi:outer membrane receptor for ferric coprogen and ferric-rhodotorulic acid
MTARYRLIRHPLSDQLHRIMFGFPIATAVLLLGNVSAHAETIESKVVDIKSEDNNTKPSSESTLPTITVQASKENKASYTAKKINIGKTTQSLKETPQSVSVVTRERLDDQNISTIEEAMKYVTGITVQRFDSAGTYSVFNARGYGSDTYQIDGTTLRTDTNGSYLDLAVFDRIEVLRGAAGMFSGAGEPGVSVNMLRKRALADFAVEGKLSAGSWNNYRGDVDVTGQLTQDGTVRGRVVAALNDFDTYMNGIDGDKKLIYGTLEFDLADRTTLSVGATYQDVNTVLSRGLPTWADGKLLDISRKTTFVQDWNDQNLKTTEFFAELEHHLENEGLIKATVRQRTRNNDAQYSDPSVPAANGTMPTFTASAFKREDKDTSADVFFNTPFQFAGQTHNFLIGADYLKGDSDTDYSPYSVPLVGSINIYTDNQNAFPEPYFAYGTNVSKNQLENYGIYNQFRIKPFDRLTLVGGGRLSWWKSTNKFTNISYDEKANFTPYAAVLFDVASDVSLYTSYSEIFKPQNNKIFGGKQIDPRTGNQIEAGIKAELLDGKLNLSSAIFQLEDENRAISDPDHETFSMPSGKARSRGFEVEAGGQITDSWSITTGYAFTRTELLKDPKNAGTTLSTFTPKHNFNLWTTYKLPASLVEGLEVGAGVRAVSSFYSQSGAVRIQQGGYALVSASVGYDINPNYKVALNLENLLDRKYYEKVSGQSRQNFFGSPRSAMLSLRMKY